MVFILFIAMALAAPAATRLKIPWAIVPLLGGVPRIRLDASVVLMGLAPPLLYVSGFEMSWPDFRANLRPILLQTV